MKKEYGITMVPAEKLRPHPKNPRKDLGDLSELTESIKQNGVMQNLTAVPDPENEGGYMIIIGHRRFAAGKAAGMTEFPVTVRDIDEQTQIKLMLCENIQRNDLTVVEQAAGFQMMIDFGITVDELSQDTGFAPSTIYHRLNIAKLDQEALTEKMEQLTLSDLIELEKIDDVEQRNKILKESDSRGNLQTRANWAYRKQEQAKIGKKIREMLEKTDLVKKEMNQWSSKVDECERTYINPDTKVEDIKIEKKVGRGVLKYTHWWVDNDNTAVLVYTLAKDKKEKKLTKKQQRMKDIEKEVADQYKIINDEVHDMIEQMHVHSTNLPKLDEATTDAFIAETFMYMAIETPALYNIDAISSGKLGVESEWNRGGHMYKDNKHAEYAADMRAALLEKIGPHACTWAAELLAMFAEDNAKRFMNSCQPVYWRDGDFLRQTEAYRLNMIVTIYGYIGFEADVAQKNLLKGEGEPFDKIRELAEEYEQLN